MALNDSPKKLKKKVLEYFEYAQDKKIRIYSPDERGIWKVVGGFDDSGREEIGLLEGRYIDAIAWAVEQGGFYGDWCSSDVVKNPNSGYVEKAEPVAIPKLKDSSSLDGLILNLRLNEDDFRKNTLAWNVDTQYDFMSPLGKLYVQGAEEIEPNLERLTEYFRNHDMRIVSTGDLHDKDSHELSENPDYVNTFPEHCMRGTKGAEHIHAVKPRDPYVIDWKDKSFDLEQLRKSKEIVLYKDDFDVFIGNPHTEAVLEALNPERVIVYGVASNVCVAQAVRGLSRLGKEVYVVEDAIKGLPNIPSPEDEWKRLGVRLILSEDLCK